jgi:hypothetical protein
VGRADAILVWLGALFVVTRLAGRLRYRAFAATSGIVLLVFAVSDRDRRIAAHDGPRGRSTSRRSAPTHFPRFRPRPWRRARSVAGSTAAARSR